MGEGENVDGLGSEVVSGVHERMRDAVRRGDAAAIGDLFSECAMLLSPDGDVFVGKEAALDFAKTNLANGMVDIVSEAQSVLAQNGLVVERGVSTVTLKDALGALSIMRVRYLTVLRRHEGGQWLIDRDAWTVLTD